MGRGSSWPQIGIPITPLLAAFAINRNVHNPYEPYYFATTAGYPNSYPAAPGVACRPVYNRNSDGSPCSI
jgi:hypothetical protein